MCFLGYQYAIHVHGQFGSIRGYGYGCITCTRFFCRCIHSYFTIGADCCQNVSFIVVLVGVYTDEHIMIYVRPACYGTSEAPQPVVCLCLCTEGCLNSKLSVCTCQSCRDICISVFVKLKNAFLSVSSNACFCNIMKGCIVSFSGYICQFAICYRHVIMCCQILCCGM